MASWLHPGLLQRLGVLGLRATAGAATCHCSTSYSSALGRLRPWPAVWSSTPSARAHHAPSSAAVNSSNPQQGLACPSGVQCLRLPGACWQHISLAKSSALQQALQGASARPPGDGLRTITTKTWRRLKMKKHKIRKRRRANRHKSK